MNPIITATINNVVILAIAIMIVSLPQRSFVWKFLKVKLSFGRLILGKIRAINRDYFAVCWIADGFLIYKIDRKNYKRIAIKDKDVFYRSLGVNWVDIDEEKNCLAKSDYSGVSGFDAIKYSDLYKRALYKPTINDDTFNFRIVMIMVGIVIIVAGFTLFLVYNMYNHVGMLEQAVSSLQKGTVVPVGGLG